MLSTEDKKMIWRSQMTRKVFMVLLVLAGLIGFGSTAIGEEVKNSKQMNATTQDNASITNLKGSILGFDLIKLIQPATVNLEVPIRLINNSTKEVWSSPEHIPVFIFAAVTNNGKMGLDVYASSDSCANNSSELAGRALPDGDGVIVYGKFSSLKVKCENSSSVQYCNGTLETSNSFPQ